MPGVRIRDARIDRLVVRDSAVELERVTVRSATGTALVAEESEVRVSGGAIVGSVAIEADRSRMDLAGVRIRGDHSAFLVGEPTRVLFSVCSVRSGNLQQHAHGAVILDAG